jgi:RNA polymerase sigma-70 factor (ECF subfamily)
VSQEFEAQLCVNDMRREALRDRIDDSLAVREGLAQIDETSRAAVVMFHIEGLTHEEIATITHQPRGTVQARVFRGRKRLYFLLTADLEAKTYD